MKKRILYLLLALVLVLSLSVPALAAETFYPVSVDEYTAGELDEPRINKVYRLSLSDDPSGIPTDDFVRDGRQYYLLDLIRKDEVGVDTQPHTETITMDSPTGELSEVLKLLDGQKDFTSEDGYSGVLLLDHTSVKVEVKGYSTKTSNLSAARTYPNLSDADLSLVPKTISDGGRTLTLANVNWSSSNQTEGEDIVQRYTATATYTGSATSKSATGYKVTANYTGELSKTGCKIVTYTAIFGGEELTPAQKETAKAASDSGSNFSSAALLCFMGGVGVLVAVLIWSNQKKRRY